MYVYYIYNNVFKYLIKFMQLFLFWHVSINYITPVMDIL